MASTINPPTSLYRLGDTGEDFVLIVDAEIGANGVFQRTAALMHSTAKLLIGQLREQSLR